MHTKNLRLNKDVEIIGHRGHVSHYPENSVAGFISAISLGVDAVEMDLVISADKQVVVSHEPYMSAAYVLNPDGTKVKRSQEKDLLLYQMTYDSIKLYDSGSRRNGRHRNQKRIPAYKPLLKEVFEKVETYRKTHGLAPVEYYLEIKSEPEGYGVSQPHPPEFVDLVMKVVKEKELEDQVVIMSFDAEILNSLKPEYPEVKVSYLLYRTSIEEGLKKLNFQPEIISPHYRQLKSAEKVEALQERGIKVVPWTLNRKRKIKKMLFLGVDGIISDYPERVMDLKRQFQD